MVPTAPQRYGAYMLDTTEFNAVAKGELPLSAIAGRRLFVTHVQLDEINKTPCERMRAQLRAAFEDIAAENLPTESIVLGVSRLGQGKFPAADSDFAAMRKMLEALDKASAKRRLNQACDILIAETAIRNKLTLVSGDPNLRKVTIEFGGHAIDRKKFMR
jgi:predicted nucleic acid-binding protein